MQLTYQTYVLLPLIALFIALVLAIRVWRYRTRPITTTFLVLMLILVWWSLTVVMEHTSLGLPTKIFWVKMSYLGIPILPIAWLVFTLQYTDREKWLTRRNLTMLSILPVITLIMVWTNDIHHLMWKDIWLDTSVSPPVDVAIHNTWFWIYAIYAYSLLLLGTLCLFGAFLHSSGIHRRQAGTMLFAALVPWVGNFLFISGIKPFSKVDPTPLAFAITGVAFSWGLSRFQLLDILPIAHETIFKSMVDGVIVLDRQHRIMELNPVAQHVIKHTRSDAIGQPLSLVLTGQAGLLELQPEITEAQTEIVLGEGQTQRYYIVNISPISIRQHFSGHLVLLHDDTERRKAEFESRRAVILETELTERKRAEEALGASEKKYRQLVESLQEGIWAIDKDNCTIFVNRPMAEMLGYSVEEMRGKHLFSFMDERGVEIAKRNLKRRGQGIKEQHEYEFLRKDGSRIYALLETRPLTDEAGNYIGALAGVIDITNRKLAEEELRKSETKYRTLVERLQEGVYQTDLEGNYTTLNMAGAKIFGFDSPDQVVGKYRTIDLYKDLKDRAKIIEELRTTGHSVCEIQAIRKDGTVIWTLVNNNATLDECGNTAGYEGVFTDITERKQMEEQLMMTDRLASIGELVSGIAHELNNPLTSVIGFSQLLMEKNTADDIKEDLGIVNSEAQRAAGIVKNLLTFARKHSPVKQLSQINNVIEDVLRLRAYEQKVNNIEVNIRFASDLPEIMADYFQMQQVFLNIIINAEYFMTQAHNNGTLTITTERVDNTIRTTFADDGPGISKENLSRIFNPFFTTKEVGKGTGLGLSICHGIVTGHGGSIYARSRLGKGATFVVELPTNAH